jgi:hypothetical protein
MRTVSGEVVLPRHVPAGLTARVLVEVRDVSAADAPSIVLGSTTLRIAALTSAGRIPFSLRVPEAPGRSLALRVQVDCGRARSPGGDYLTTESVGVADTGDVAGVLAPVTPVS